MIPTSTSKAFEINKGFICIATLNRFDELRRFLTSFKKFNSLPISVIIARDQPHAHHLKTLCGFLTPFEYTCLMDIDILVNGDLSDIFELTPKNMIGIVREKKTPVLNSGVVVFSKEIMMEICEKWSNMFEKDLIHRSVISKGIWDQQSLNKILKDYFVHELPSCYNHILKDYSPEEELKMFDEVKVFHFLHAPDIPREKYKSYQIFMSL